MPSLHPLYAVTGVPKGCMARTLWRAKGCMGLRVMGAPRHFERVHLTTISRKLSL